MRPVNNAGTSQNRAGRIWLFGATLLFGNLRTTIWIHVA